MDIFRGRKKETIQDTNTPEPDVSVPRTPLEFAIYATVLEPYITRIEGQVEIGTMPYEFFVHKTSKAGEPASLIRVELKSAS